MASKPTNILFIFCYSQSKTCPEPFSSCSQDKLRRRIENHLIPSSLCASLRIERSATSLEGDLAIYLRNPLRILNESAESVLRQATVIIEALHERVIERGAGLLIESISAH